MTTIRRIPTSKIDGNNSNATDTDEIRPYGEIAVYIDESGPNDKLTLMMFDGERTHLKSKVLAAGVVYGSDADSGDGNNRDTIKLIPDAELHQDDGSFSNDQYLIIDPTIGDPVGHIHIRAGGSMDNSTADLFLGGEQNNVRVSDTNDRVSITADAGEGGIKTWLFDGGGAVTFPDSTVQTTAYTGSEPIQLLFDSGGIEHNAGFSNGVDEADFQIRLNTHLAGEEQIIWGFDTDGSLTFPDGGSLRVGTAPATSVGQEGDIAGTVAFDNNYIYYCIADYVINTFNTTVGSPGVSTDTIPVVKGLYGTPTTDWTVTFGGVEYSITNVTDGGTTWILTTPGQVQIGGTGIGVTLFNGSGIVNIWKRVAWSDDVWGG
jgi:hypothetical protein